MAKALGAGCWRFSKSSSHPGCRHFGALDKEQIEQVKSTEALQASKDLLAKPAASLLYVSSSGTCGQLDSSQRETSLHAVRDVAERFGWQKTRLQRRAPRQGNASGRARAEAVSAGQKSVIFLQGFPPQQTLPHGTGRKVLPQAESFLRLQPALLLVAPREAPHLHKARCSWRRSEVGTRGARLSQQLPKFSFVAQPRSPLARAVAAADAVVFSSEINCATNPAPR